MKKIIIFLLIIAEAGYVFSQNISFDLAQKTANQKIIYFNKSDNYTIEKSEIIKNSSDLQIAYLFILKPKGYIVVSAYDYLPPVISYSFTSDFGELNTKNVLFDILVSDLSKRIENKEFIYSEKVVLNKKQWTQIQNNIQQKIDTFQQWPPEGSTSTGGWVITQWTQSAPYNNFCPSYNGNRSVAGCPAIAMGQIINYFHNLNFTRFTDNDDYYHNYNYGYWIDNDYETYNFPSFPSLNSYLDVLEEKYIQSNYTLTNNDKAAITFACGTACTQVYNPAGSGTFGVDQAFDAYLRFDYDSCLLLTTNDTTIISHMAQNIKDSLPVHFAVVTPAWDAGHNVVVDGYNTDGYFHVNFGWAGAYDGWYLLPDQMPYNLTVIEGAVVDIYPVQNQNSRPEISNSDTLMNEDAEIEFSAGFIESNYTDNDNDPIYKFKIVKLPENGILSYNDNNIFLNQEIFIQNFSFLKYIPNENYNGLDSFRYLASDMKQYSSDSASVYIEINPINDVPYFELTDSLVLDINFEDTVYIDFNLIVPENEQNENVIFTLNPQICSFADIIVNNELKRLEISSINDSIGSQLFEIAADDGQNENNTYTNNFYLRVYDFVNLNDNTEEINIFPNPVYNYFTISGLSNINQVEISDLSGKIYKVSKLNKINISDLKSGVYNIKIISENKTYNKTIIKN